MRYVFLAWALPLMLFWGWYFLSLNDVSFGFTMLTRDAHDLVFRIYGHVLGLDPQVVPGLAARACIVDTGTILAIWAFRRRREIMAWIGARRDGRQGAAATRYSGISSSRSV